MSFRYRPRSLLLRRTSSCSSLQLSGLIATAAGGVGIGGRHHKLPSKDWACNDGAPPSGHFLQVPGEEEEDEENEKENKEKNNNNKNKSRPPPPPIILEPSREGTVEHISVIEDPDPQCHFCCEQTSRPVHENCTRLKIVSRGMNEKFLSVLWGACENCPRI